MVGEESLFGDKFMKEARLDVTRERENGVFIS